MPTSIGESATFCVVAFPRGVNYLRPFATLQPSRGVGSGFFIEVNASDPNVYVALTCYHVVADATEVQLLIGAMGSKKINARVLSVMPDHDIAVLVTRLPADAKVARLQVFDSDSLKAGDAVATYGYPLASKNLKVSQGVYAGLSDDGLLQTTAAISPGNSGGPMCHGDKVIGIVSAKIVSIVASNVGFAVPISYWKMYAHAMVVEKQPVVLRPMFGFCSQTVPPALWECERNGSDECQVGARGGILVIRVYDTCPIVGLRVGDIVTSFEWASGDGRARFEIDAYGEVAAPWSSSRIDYLDILDRSPIGREVTFNTTRGAMRGVRRVGVRTGILRRYIAPQQTWPFVCALGMCFVPLCSNLIRSNDKDVLSAIMSIPDEDRHRDRVIVSWVIPGSVASEFKIAAGALVAKINGVVVRNIPQLASALEKPRNDLFVVEFSNSRMMCTRVAAALRAERAWTESNTYVTSKAFMSALESRDRVRPGKG